MPPLQCACVARRSRPPREGAQHYWRGFRSGGGSQKYWWGFVLGLRARAEASRPESASGAWSTHPGHQGRGAFQLLAMTRSFSAAAAGAFDIPLPSSRARRPRAPALLTTWR